MVSELLTQLGLGLAVIGTLWQAASSDVQSIKKLVLVGEPVPRWFPFNGGNKGISIGPDFQFARRETIGWYFVFLGAAFGYLASIEANSSLALQTFVGVLTVASMILIECHFYGVWWKKRKSGGR